MSGFGSLVYIVFLFVKNSNMFSFSSFYDESTGRYSISRETPGVAEILRKRGVSDSEFDSASVDEKLRFLIEFEHHDSICDWNSLILRYAGKVPEQGTVFEKPLEVGHSMGSTSPVDHQHGKILEEFRQDGASWKNGHQMKMYPHGFLIVNIWTQWFEVTCLDHVIMLQAKDGEFTFENYIYNGFGYGLQSGREKDAFNILEEYASNGPVSWRDSSRPSSVTYMPRISDTGSVVLIGDDGSVHQAASHLSRML